MQAFSSLTILCITPYQIPNPNYGVKFKAGDINSLKDCTSRYINIPCGHCDECIATKQMYLVQRIQAEALGNHIFFCTLTYNNESLPYLDTSSGYRIRYAAYADLQLFFKRLRREKPFGNFRYIAVTERGTQKARPHIHILFLIRKADPKDKNEPLHLERIMFDKCLEYWARNVGTNRKPIYKPNCTYIRKFIGGKLRTNYDLHYVRPRQGSPQSAVAFYVMKYMLKGNSHERQLQQALKLNYSESEYYSTWKLVRSRICMSKGFGLNPESFSRKGIQGIDPEIIKYIREGIERAKANEEAQFPYFFNTDNGKTFPLAPYYKKKSEFYKFDDAISFYYKNMDSQFVDSPVFIDESKTTESFFRKYYSRSEAIHKTAEELCVADDLDLLYEQDENDYV